MDNSSATQNRRSRRSQVYLTATLEGAGPTMTVKLRNLSSEGALVEANDLPAEGSEVVFNRNELSTPGRVVWVNGNHAGIAFGDRLQPEQVLRHVPQHQPKVPPEFRRPGLASRELTADERRLVESWVWSPRERPGE